MAVFILNSPIITNPGEYRVKIVDLDRARELARRGISAIGHQATADFLSGLLGVEVECNRIRIRMEPGDKALVFKLNSRLQEGKILSEEELRELDYELWEMERIR